MGPTMRKTFRIVACLCALPLGCGGAFADPRVALIIGNSAYKGLTPAPLAGADAGAVSETLRGTGYAVTDVRDLGQADFGKTVRDFLDKTAEGGAQTDAFFYFAGYGAQLDSENYLVPVDANIRAPADIANEAFRLNDFLAELAKLQTRTKIVVLDAARDHKIANGAKGLAITEVPAGLLVAYSAAPGSVSLDGQGSYSVYGAALASQMRDPALEINDVFKTARASVNQTTNGQQTPWSASSLAVQFHLFEPRAQAEADAQIRTASLRPSNAVRSKQDLAALQADAAYQAVIELDTLKAYQWFVELYPKDARAAEVWRLIAKRREALLWRRAATRNTRTAYWNYIKRYPDGPYLYEARERLVLIGEPIDPPFDYVPVIEPLAVDYVDEAIGVPELYYVGAPVAPVFDATPPVLVEAPPPLVPLALPAMLIPAILAIVPFVNHSAPALAQPALPAFDNLRVKQSLANVSRRDSGVANPGVRLPTAKVQTTPLLTNVAPPPAAPPRNPGLSLPPSTRLPQPGGGPTVHSAPSLPPVPGSGGAPLAHPGPVAQPGPVGGPVAHTQPPQTAPSPTSTRGDGPTDRLSDVHRRQPRESHMPRPAPSRQVERIPQRRAPPPIVHRAPPRQVFRPQPQRPVMRPQAPRPVAHRPVAQRPVVRAAPRPVVRAAPRPVFRPPPRPAPSRRPPPHR